MLLNLRIALSRRIRPIPNRARWLCSIDNPGSVPPPSVAEDKDSDTKVMSTDDIIAELCAQKDIDGLHAPDEWESDGNSSGSKSIVHGSSTKTQKFSKLLALGISGMPLLPTSYSALVVEIPDPAVANAIRQLSYNNQSVFNRYAHVGLFQTPASVEPESLGDLSAVASTAMRLNMSFRTTKYRAGVYHDISDLTDMSSIGTLASVVPISTESNRFVFAGLERVRIQNMVYEDSELPIVKVEYPESDEIKDLRLIEDYRVEFKQLMEKITEVRIKLGITTSLPVIDGVAPEHFSDSAANFCARSPEEMQELLEEFDVLKRLKMVKTMLESELSHVESRLEVDIKVSESEKAKHRKAYLWEQYQTIGAELGLNRNQDVIEKFREQLKGKSMTEEVEKVVNSELEKLSRLQPESSEYNMTRNYVDWLTLMPWGVYTEEMLDLKRAQTILDEDHYGLDEIKDRILEFIAVGKKLGAAPSGRILCLQGPPGCGKTSIGKSVARALGREFNRFSIGGVYDVSDIKGHRRTYVGALPGRLVQALKRTGTSNPVILIDEIDKIGRSAVHGDPSAALLEALDPEQNSNFLDHYLDVNVDLSKVLFICTANRSDTISSPLADRMEFIQLSGYILDEKLEIAKKYLCPTVSKGCGITTEDVVVEESALKAIIRSYAVEAGVRSLEKEIQKVYRKCARELVTEPKEGEVPAESPIRVTEANLEKYLGKPKFPSHRLHEKSLPGVVAGLAWSAHGGSTVNIETVFEASTNGEKNSSLRTTGHVERVMEESTQIAFTVAKNHLADDPTNPLLTSKVHLHFPSGAIQKDGPSAGAAIALAFLSLGLGKPLKEDFALTGELTLTGKITKIGGVREKLVAAHRDGFKRIALPKENLSEYEELPEFLKNRLEVDFVSTFDELVELAFPKE